MQPDSKVVHAGPRNPSGGLAPPLDRSAVYETPAEGPPFGYGRSHTPGAWDVEAVIGSLEDAGALVFTAGMAALGCLALATLGSGAVVAVPSAGYYETQLMMREVLGPFGVETRVYDAAEPGALHRACQGARLVVVETPATPLLQVIDIGVAAEAARSGGALLICDNTVATPLHQQPLELGADVSWYSGTKLFGGHHDLIAGALVSRDAALLDRVRDVRRMLGVVLAPDPAWLLLRGLRTLALRVPRQSATALELARRLEGHAAVRRVYYPGLPSHADHALAARQMHGGAGCLLSFELADAAAGDRVLSALRLIRHATSFGGAETTCERRSRVEPGRVPDGLLRVSAGIEAVEDVWRDLAGALDASDTCRSG
jgi:cystathionine beta-lyase/cystathionine gamma-synthase